MHQLEWHRVILDESHSIKGRGSNAAHSISKLRVRNKWCLTGTPFGKHVHDIEAQLSFIGMKQRELNLLNTRNLTIFNGKKSALSLDQQKRRVVPLINVMKSVVMRHRKSQQFNGRPLLNMQRRSEDVILIDFSSTERGYYDKLYATAKEQYEYYKAMGNVGRGTIKILASLLPARRACSGLFCGEYTVHSIHSHDVLHSEHSQDTNAAQRKSTRIWPMPKSVRSESGRW